MRRASRFFQCISRRKYKSIIFAQLIILIFFLCWIYVSKPIDTQTVKEVVVIVDDMSYEYVVSEFRFSVFSDSIKYQFSNKGILSEYSNRDLYESVQIGDQIFIKYVEKYGLFGKTNWIVDARTETKVYRSIEEDYRNQKTAFLLVIGMFAFIEFVFLISVVLYVLYNRRHKCRRKNEHRTHEHK